ncbi:MAG TPA: lytic transglycosylase domain-containing protein [Candidatus Tyrphobacter sp.]
MSLGADFNALARRIVQIGGTPLQPLHVPQDDFHDAVEASRAAIAPPLGSLRTSVARIARAGGLDPALVEAVIECESGFDPHATSGAGAQGLMQLMPGTARALGVPDPYDPIANVSGGVRYLRGLLERFGNLRLALAAYNAGPAAVERYGGVPPFTQTQRYVEGVLAAYRRKQHGAP